MTPMPDRPISGDSRMEAMLAFDEAMAAGADPSAIDGPSSPLDAVHECQRLLEAIWPRSVPATPGLPGRFGRFSIVRELGRGGFGVVFLAGDPVLRRQVALKVPRPEVLVAESTRRRFLREAEAASRLDHPHIVPVYEVGEEGPVCFIASAYCEGPTLADWQQRRTEPVPWFEAARLVATLAAAVAHAHQRGILHRDLKPGNILLQPGESPAPGRGDERAGRVLGDYLPRICDFGLAKLLDEVSPETATGLAIGSPPYMAPEQAAGRTREQGPATDVYALGVILYELLTGRPPLRGETDLETLRLVADEDPPPPRALRPGLPRDLETIALKCLEKRPDRRYAAASELAEDLGRFLDGRPVRARRASPWERAAKWARRRPAHAALAAVLATIVLGGLAGLEWARARERRHNEEVGEALDRSRRSQEGERRQHDLLVRSREAYELKQASSFIERGQRASALSILEALPTDLDAPDSRGFPWRFLDAIARQGVRPLPPLSEMVYGAAYSPDGRTIALADRAGNTIVVDRESGRSRPMPSRPRLSSNPRPFFSPDGRCLAVMSHGPSSQDWMRSEVKLWDLERGEEVEGLPAEFRILCELVFSPDGQTLVTVEIPDGNPEFPVRTWKLSDDRRRVTLVESLRRDQLHVDSTPGRRPAGPVSRPFRPSDVVAVTPEVGNDFAMGVWIEGPEFRLYSQSAYCQAACFVRGSEVVVLPRSDAPQLYSPAQVDDILRKACKLTGAARARPISHDVSVQWARFSPDGRTVAALVSVAGTPPVRMRLINVATGTVIAECPLGDVVPHYSSGFHPDGGAVVIGGIGHGASEWDVRVGNQPVTLRGRKEEVWGPEAPLYGRTDEVWGLAFSRDGRTLVSASDDWTLKFWDVASGRERGKPRKHGSLVTTVAYSPDGTLLASASYDRTIRLWDAETGDPLETLKGHTGRLRTIAFSPDGERLASGGEDRAVRIWDVAARRPLLPPLIGHTGTLFSIAFSPDGKTLFSGADRTIRLWDMTRGKLRATWPSKDEVYALAVSPDGQTLAAADHGGTVTLWEVASGRSRASLAGHVGEVLGVVFSPDGRTLASAGHDQTVRLWDPVTAQELLVLKGHQAPVRPVTFSRDGTILATGSYDGTIKLWRAPKPPK